MVLGLLMMKPMSGYEMQTYMQISETDKWAGILPGSIYHALKKMEKEQLVQIEAVEHTGHRAKAIYSITEQGREEMMNMLRQSLAQSSIELPTTFYTAVSFLHMLPTEMAVKAIDEQITLLQTGLASMKLGQQAKESYAPLPAYIALSFENMFEQYEIQLNYLHKLKDCLSDMQAQSAIEFPPVKDEQ
nr:PadR family transcriptional regulator [Paenibacillus arenosi]